MLCITSCFYFSLFVNLCNYPDHITFLQLAAAKRKKKKKKNRSPKYTVLGGVESALNCSLIAHLDLFLGCFGPRPSVISVSSSAEINQAKNTPGFDSYRRNTAYLKAHM